MLAVIILVSILLQRTRYRWLILIIISILTIILVPSTVKDRVMYTFQSNAASSSVLGIDTTGRADYYWPRAWEQAIRYFPMGVGFMQLPVANGDGQGAYNQYLNWLAEFGIVGFSLGVWMIVSIVRYLWKMIKFLKV